MNAATNIDYTDESFARVKWGGVWAGLVTSLLSYLVLTVLGAAVGLISYDPSTDAAPSAKGVAIGAAIWLGISTLLSAYLGGFIAARSAGSGATKSQGRYTGLLTGMMLALGLTILTASAIASGVSGVFSIAGSIMGTGAQLGQRAASQVNPQDLLNRLGLQDEYQAITSGMNNEEVNRLVTQAVPELRPEQARAVSDAVGDIVRTARDNVKNNLTNIRQLDDVVSQQAGYIQQQLSGPNFIGQLQARGLSEQQARSVTTALNNRVNQLRDQGRAAMQTVKDQTKRFAEQAADTAGTAAWTWLISTVLILTASLIGGQNGASNRPEVRRAERPYDIPRDESRRVGNI